MFGLGVMELVALAVVALLLFGSSLPAMMRWLGSTMAELKKEADKVTQELREVGK
ncbi:MAG: twin-arginine translocase TatA/TatE family subunit [Gemmataceae bacterium]